MEENEELRERMKALAESYKSTKPPAPKVEVSVHTKVMCTIEWWVIARDI